MDISPGNMRGDGGLKGKGSQGFGNICQCYGCFKDIIVKPIGYGP